MFTNSLAKLTKLRDKIKLYDTSECFKISSDNEYGHVYVPANQRLSIATERPSQQKINSSRPIREEDQYCSRTYLVDKNSLDFSVSKHVCLRDRVQFLCGELTRSPSTRHTASPLSNPRQLRRRIRCERGFECGSLKF